MTHKTETKERLVVEELIVETHCNMCAKNCELEPGWDSHYVRMYASWGYGSQNDGLTEEAHICEKCWMILKKLFILPPTTGEN